MLDLLVVGPIPVLDAVVALVAIHYQLKINDGLVFAVQGQRAAIGAHIAGADASLVTCT